MVVAKGNVVVVVGLAIGLVIIAHTHRLLAQEKPASAEVKPAEAKAAAKAEWIEGLSAGYWRGIADGKLLLVRVGAESCPWCHKLAAELEKPELQAALAVWTLVYIDADKLPDDARAMGVSAIPALRVVTQTGRVLALHDGFVAAEELQKWLGEQHDAASLAGNEDLLAPATTAPDAVAVARMVRLLGERNAPVREAAIRRLKPHRDLAREPVVKALIEGNLATRLAALELLSAWRAPVDGLDPWQPETLTAARRAAIERWTTIAIPDEPPAIVKLEGQTLRDAHAEIERLARANFAEAETMIEHLSRFGPALLPEATAMWKAAATDGERQKLLALRYRLLASGSLALRWPGGTMRLASLAEEERRQAAAQLVELAASDDQPLLSELFRDADPLVRELALRGLRRVGGAQATTTLVALLDDPEPNVRAAVLKQLAEQPIPALVAKVAAYAQREKDPDLVVHAIRFLKAAGGKAASMTLIELLKHPSWQVRAEATESLAKLHDFRHGNKSDDSMKARLAMAGLLDDADSFVVAKALEALKQAAQPLPIERLMGVVKKHPSLTVYVIEMLRENSSLRSKAGPKLRELAKNADSAVRIAAIQALCSVAYQTDLSGDLSQGLDDAETKVRAATALAIVANMKQLRPSAGDQVFGDVGALSEVTDPGPAERSLVGKLFDLFTPKPLGGVGSLRATKPAVEKSKPAAPDSKSTNDENHRPMDKPPVQPPGTTADDVPAPPPPLESVGPTTITPPPSAPRLPPSPEDSLDSWLTDRSRGEGLPIWSGEICTKLEAMLTAKADEERAAAALALAALGRAEKGLPALLDVAKVSPALFRRAAELLPWLPWSRRVEVYRQMLALAADNDGSLATLVELLGESHDPRSADELWKLLQDPQTAQRRAVAVSAGLKSSLIGAQWSLEDDDSADRRRSIAAQLKPQAETGPAWQRLLAVELLTRVSAWPASANAAEKLAADQTAPEIVRSGAFQLRLGSLHAADRRKAAVEALATHEAGQRRIALVYLTDGIDSLSTLPGLGLHLNTISDETSRRFVPDKAENVEALSPPKGLTAEGVEPLLADSDAETRARAGYLLALLGERRGLAPLLDYWRAKRGERWSRLVYRAIAALDDSQSLPVLEQIFDQLRKQGDLKEFYWTIRTMTGPAVLSFRSQIRREVGMENLR